MKTKVISTIEKYDMIPEGSRVIVALSGGSDSMSLLTVLYMLKDELNFTLEAAHVNHMLRGKDADDDENFVKNHCEKLGIKIHILKADVKGEAKKSGESLEEAGRRIRYEFFASLGEDCLIATAHNLGDRIETFFFNFTRGASLKGLCSIPPVRGNIIRPIIECSKAEILDFLKENSVDYRTDKTNSDTVYSRNRIRHNIIPELREINPSFEQNAARCINLLSEDEKFLHSLGEELIEKSKKSGGYDIQILHPSPVPVKARALSSIISEETGVFPDAAAINSVMKLLDDYVNSGEGKGVDIPGGIARTGAGLLKFPKKNEYSPDKVVLSEKENQFGKYIIKIAYSEKYTVCSPKETNNVYNYLLDANKISGKVYASVRQSGDSISLPGRNITKSLRKLQNEKGIPPEERDFMPVIRDDEGILLAAGCGIDKRAAVTAETGKILQITILKQEMASK